MTKYVMQDLLDAVRAGNKKEETNPIFIILAVIGGIAAIALIAYGVYRFLTPDYFDDYDDDDDFDEDFDDDFEDDFEDEEEIPAEA